MSATSPLSPQVERRAFRRIAVRLPVVVRAPAPDGAAVEESTHSFNISRMGAAFAARLPLEVGRIVEVTIPAPGPRRDSARDFFTRARVVRVDSAPPVAVIPSTAENYQAAINAGPPNPPRVTSAPPPSPVAAVAAASNSPDPASSTRLIAVEFLGQQYPHVFVSESTS